MSKNNINRIVQEELARGKDREQLFKELCSKAQSGEEKKIAFAIASVPIDEYRRDFNKTNILLAILLTVCAVLIMLTELPPGPGEGTLFPVMRTLLPFVFIYFVYKFYGGIYRFISLWTLLELLQSAVLTAAEPVTNLVLFKLLVLFSTMAISWYIARKVFPHLSVFGPRRDGQGNFLI